MHHTKLTIELTFRHPDGDVRMIRTLNIASQPEVFIATQRFSIGERKRLLSALGIEGEPLRLSIIKDENHHAVDIYDNVQFPPRRAHGMRFTRPAYRPTSHIICGTF